jgi:hypothetical protein
MKVIDATLAGSNWKLALDVALPTSSDDGERSVESAYDFAAAIDSWWM